MLTDKEIEDIALKYIRLCGGHWENEEAIPDGYILEFARAVEKAVMFWHHIKAKMNLEI